MSVLNTYRFSTEEYHRLGETGIFHEDDRIELLEGELVIMSPIGCRHAAVVNSLTRLLSGAAGSVSLLSVQNPIRLDDATEPEPDLALLKPREDAYASALPTPEDVLLVIEVADASLDYDRGPKLSAYARNGVKEVWIVNLIANVLEVNRSPEGDDYRSKVICRRGEQVSPELFPDIGLAVSDFLIG